MRSAGIVHTAPSRSICSHRALRTSPERAAVSTRNSNASMVPRQAPEPYLANGSFFQPTGFPDIGACVYTDGKGQRRCLVESELGLTTTITYSALPTFGGWSPEVVISCKR